MVFSVPLYLDPPNWQQHPNHQHQLQGGNNSNNININQGNNENQHLMQATQVQQPQPQPQMGMGGGCGGVGAQQIRPNSMAERARQLKIPPPEAPLKCPRCDSSNTKFCYFNNYSLTQPRHFCKACRRYWTRGGALRNVPVGGGCRRNKRSSSKSSSGGDGGSGGGPSRSPLASPTSMVGGERHRMNLVNSSGLNISSALNGLSSGGSIGGVGGGLSFMASLQNIAQLGGMGGMGLASFGGSLGGLAALTGAAADGGNNGGSDHIHHMDFPQLNHSQQVQFPNYLGGFEIAGASTGAAGGLFSPSFRNEDHHTEGVGGDQDVEEQVNDFSKSSQFASVKMEDGPGLNLARQLMGLSSSPARDTNTTTNNNSQNHQFNWGGNMINNNASAAAASSMWTDLSRLNPSSATHPL